MSRVARHRHVTVRVVGTFVAVLLVLPTLVVIPISFAGNASFLFPPESWSLRWYEQFFTNQAWIGSLRRSLLIGAISAVAATVVGTAAALGLARWTARRSVFTLRALLISPILIPGVVLAVGVFFTFNALGLVGTLPGFVVAHTALGLPFVVISVGAALAGVDPQLAPAAESLGASKWAVARSVTLPLVFPGVLAGFLLAFVTSFDEILVALFIRSPFLETLPVRMYTSVVSDIDPTIAAASTIVLLLTTLLLVAGGAVLAIRGRRLRGTAP